MDMEGEEKGKGGLIECPYCKKELKARGYKPHLYYKHGISKNVESKNTGFVPVAGVVSPMRSVRSLSPTYEPALKVEYAPPTGEVSGERGEVHYGGPDPLDILKGVLYGEVHFSKRGVVDNLVYEYSLGDIYDLEELDRLLTRALIEEYHKHSVLRLWAKINKLRVSEKLGKEIGMEGGGGRDKEKDLGEDPLKKKKELLKALTSTEEESVLNQKIELEKKRMQTEMAELDKKIKGIEVGPIQQQQVNLIKRPMFNSDGSLKTDQAGNIIYEYTPSIQNDPSTMVLGLVGALSTILYGKKQEEGREEKAVSTYMDKQLQVMQEERKILETKIEQAKMREEAAKEELRKKEIQFMLNKMEEINSQIRSPKQYITEIKESIDIGKSIGMIDTGARDIEQQKMTIDHEKWRYEQDKMERAEQIKAGFYKDLIGMGKDVLEKAPTLIEKLKGRGSNLPFQSSQQSQRFINPTTGDIFDAEGNLIEVGQKQQAPISASALNQGGYTDEELAKLDAWRKEGGKDVEGIKGGSSVGDSAEGAVEGDISVFGPGSKKGGKRKPESA